LDVGSFFNRLGWLFNWLRRIYRPRAQCHGHGDKMKPGKSTAHAFLAAAKSQCRAKKRGIQESISPPWQSVAP
jgi:hypothetical protein